MRSIGTRWVPAWPRPLCCLRWWSPAATCCCDSGIAQRTVRRNELLAAAPASLRTATRTARHDLRVAFVAPTLRAERRHRGRRDRADRLDRVSVRLDSADIAEKS